MSIDTLRVYESGRFHDVEVPDWYREAERLCETENLGWHRALDRVLDVDGTILTPIEAATCSIEIIYWPSETCGTLVLIETPLSLLEQVVIPNAVDWLAFLSTYLAPLIMAAAQTATSEMQCRIGNALISYARHGSGEHIDRQSGNSMIDLQRDRERRKRQTAQAVR